MFLNRLLDARTFPHLYPDLDLSPFHMLAVEHVIATHEEHAELDLSTLCSVCLTCGSIAATHDNDNREALHANVDLTCCRPDSTVLFRNLRPM